MARDLGIGFIGAGNVAKSHVLGWRQTDGATPVVVCRRDDVAVKQFAHDFNLEWTTDYHDVLQREDVDVVDILLPSGAHAEVGIAAARAGKHVLVEKPIDVTLQKADRLIAACNDNGVRLGVISQYRFMDGVLKMQEVLAEGKLGELIQGDACIKWFRPQSYYDSGAWRGTWELDGGGPFMNQGIHFIDLLLSAMGPVKSVYAKTKTMIHSIEVEDVGVALLEFQNGAVGVIEASTAMFPGRPARLDIHGTKGALSMEGGNLAFLHLEGGVPQTASVIDADGSSNPLELDVTPFVRQFTDMVEAIHTEREPIVNGKVSRRPLELILAIYESSRLGREVWL